MKKQLSAALAVALAATACGSSDDADKKPAVVKGGTFTYALPADPGALDPAGALLGATNTTLGFAYDSLVYSDAAGKIIPGLAESWKADAGGVAFTIRKGVTCADGSAVTAQTVADSMNWMADPKNKAGLLDILIPAGMKATVAGDVVTLTPKTPNPFLLETMTPVYVVCGKGLTDRSVLQKGTSGSGPYTLTEAVPNDHYTFKVRKEYAWGPGGTAVVDGMPDTITLKIVKDESTAANQIITGGLTGGQFIGVDRKRLESAPGITKSTAPDGIGDLLFHEGADRPTASFDVRKALMASIDLTELRKLVSAGNGIAPTHLTSLAPDPCRVDSVTGNLPASDPAAATAALDTAGWKAGGDGIRAKDGKKLTLRLVYPTSGGPAVQAGMEYLGQKWKVIGVDVKLVGEDQAKYGESLGVTESWDVSWVALGLSLPTQMVGNFSGPGPDKKGGNFGQVNNAEYVKLTGQAAKAVGSASCPLWAAAETALIKNLDIVPVVQPTQLVASKGASLDVIGGIVRPTSIRMLAP